MKVKSLITYDFIHIKLISRKGNTKCRWGESPHASYPWWSVNVLFVLPSVCVQFLAQAAQGLHPPLIHLFWRSVRGTLPSQAVLCVHPEWSCVSLCPCVRTLLLVTGKQRRKGLSRSGKEWARFPWKRKMNPFQKQKLSEKVWQNMVCFVRIWHKQRVTLLSDTFMSKETSGRSLKGCILHVAEWALWGNAVSKYK